MILFICKTSHARTEPRYRKIKNNDRFCILALISVSHLVTFERNQRRVSYSALGHLPLLCTQLMQITLSIHILKISMQRHRTHLFLSRSRCRLLIGLGFTAPYTILPPSNGSLYGLLSQLVSQRIVCSWLRTHLRVAPNNHLSPRQRSPHLHEHFPIQNRHSLIGVPVENEYHYV